MIESEYIFAIIFVLIVCVLCVFAKKTLYVNEHEKSIENELNSFKDNIKEIDHLHKLSDYKIGSDHLYK